MKWTQEKTQVTDWDKIFENHICDKALELSFIKISLYNKHPNKNGQKIWANTSSQKTFRWKTTGIVSHSTEIVTKWKQKLLSHFRLFVTHRLYGPWNSPGQNTGAFPFSRGSSQLRDWTQVSRITDGFFISWGTQIRATMTYYFIPTEMSNIYYWLWQVLSRMWNTENFIQAWWECKVLQFGK